MLLGMVEGHTLFLSLTVPENAFEAVFDCNAYLEAILHIHMLLGLVEGPSFLVLTIPENSFEAVFDCNAYLEVILH